MRLFDIYLAVDWSASSKPAPMKPSPNAIWVGELAIDDRLGISQSSETYFRTRALCRKELRRRLLGFVQEGRRVFLSFDFAYGYPAGLAAASGLEGSAPRWRLVWNELCTKIEDSTDNVNNRFAVANSLNQRIGGALPGPFWGYPDAVGLSHLPPKGVSYPYRAASGTLLEAKRTTERLLPGTHPTWKLWTAGSVGGQTLVGIPTVAALRNDPDLRHVSRVWPFETGFALEPSQPGSPSILHVEIWPGVVKGKVDLALPIPDRAQVRAMVEWLAALDTAGELLSLFQRPHGLSDRDVQAAVEEEGWIFGAVT